MRVLIVVLGVLCGSVSAQDAGVVVSATPRCAVIRTPTHHAFVTGQLEVKKGDAVQGALTHHSYGNLQDTHGRHVAWRVRVEDTERIAARLAETMERRQWKC